MKRTLIYIAATAFIGLIGILINGCGKNDDYPPVITVTGPSPAYVSLNGKYTDPSATAIDFVTGASLGVNADYGRYNPNLNRTGVYTITYWAISHSNIKGYAYRNVIVKNDADFLANTYLVFDTAGGIAYNYSQTISSDTAKDYRIHFSSFGNYNNNTNIYANVSVNKDSVNLPLQTVNNIGFDLESHKFNGTALISGQNFVLTYTDNNLTQGRVVNGVAHYIKQ